MEGKVGMMEERKIKSNKDVHAFTCKLHHLITGKLHEPLMENNLRFPLNIDRYQRPYVWDQKKVHQLLSDFKNHHKGAYYLGSILLHEDIERRRSNVIDGQQRLTTLLLLYKKVFEEKTVSEHMALGYYHRESYENIKLANELIEKYFNLNNLEETFKKTLPKIEISIIKTDDLDLAFTFFDSQNSRGVQLSSTDILKSYHLREINQLERSDRKYLERSSAIRWEKLQTFEGILNTDHDFAFELFHKLLWRSRRWKGSEIEKENRDLVIEEFQEGTVSDPENRSAEIPLYPNRHNMLSKSIIESKDGGLQRSGDYIRISANTAELPFTLRQPIHSGLHYFLFAEKYAKILYELFKEETDNKEINHFRSYFNEVVEENSYYLIELFMVSSVTYFDKYGTDRLHVFAELLGLSHGIKRFKQHYIFRQSVLKYVREFNLLDIISYSFRPEEVFEALKQHIFDEKNEGVTSHVKLLDRGLTRNKEQFELTDIDGNGVNERCLKAFVNYYDERIEWNQLRDKDRNLLDLNKFSTRVYNSLKNEQL